MEVDRFSIFKKKSSDEIIFDCETTGLSKDHDNIIEFAAEDLGSEARISFPIKKRKETIANPEALKTTGKSFQELRKATISQYDASTRIKEIFEKKSIVYGHNVGFDRAFVAQSLFMNGHFPYLLSCDKVIIDTLPLFSMASQFSSKFVIPEINGKLSHKLEHIFKANFQEDFPAHVASGDVSATKKLLLRVRDLAPSLWDARQHLFSKHERSSLIESNRGVVAYNWFNREFKILFGAFHSKKMSLVIDPTELPNDIDGVIRELDGDKRPKFLKLIYPSILLPVMKEDFFPELRLKFATPNMVFLERVKDLVRKSKFITQEFNDKKFLENQAFGFPDNIDKENWDLFHESSTWEERERIEFITIRSKRLKQRILFEEAPYLLPKEVISMMKEAIAQRWMAGEDSPWLTIEKAVSIIDNQKIVDFKMVQYRQYLMKLRNRCLSFRNVS